MLTHNEREKLPYQKLIENNAIGYDCEGNFIHLGDEVEVIIPETLRAGNPKYAYCDKGRQGTVMSKDPGWHHWFIGVEFKKSDHKGEFQVGCVDYHLRKVA